MPEQAHAPTGASTNTAAPRVLAPPIPPSAATPPAPAEAALAAESDAKVAAAEAALAAERVRSTIATKLLATDTRLAGESAFGIIEQLVAKKVADGVDVADAVGVVLSEHPYLKAAVVAAAPAAEVAGATTGATTGVSPAAAGTVSPGGGLPPAVRNALTMTSSEWAAHRKLLGV